MICAILMLAFAIAGAIAKDYTLCIASGLCGIGYGICRVSFEIGRWVDGKDGTP